MPGCWEGDLGKIKTEDEPVIVAEYAKGRSSTDIGKDFLCVCGPIWKFLYYEGIGKNGLMARVVCTSVYDGKECGNEKSVVVSRLEGGRTSSCIQCCHRHPIETLRQRTKLEHGI